MKTITKEQIESLGFKMTSKPKKFIRCEVARYSWKSGERVFMLNHYKTETAQWFSLVWEWKDMITELFYGMTAETLEDLQLLLDSNIYFKGYAGLPIN